MNYTDIGFDAFLLRSLEASFTEQIGIESISSLNQISGLQVKGDKITSLNKSLNIDLENDAFTVEEGEIKRVEIGRLPDGKIGVVLRNNQNIALLNITGDEHLIQSADGKTFFNLKENKMQVADDKGITLIDGTGLVSLSSFNNGFTTDATTQDTASSTYVDANGLTLNFSLTREANVLFACTLQGLNTAAEAGGLLVATLALDGEPIGASLCLGGVPYGTIVTGGVLQIEGYNPISASSFVIKKVSLGSHIIKVQYKAQFGGTSRLVPYTRTLAYLVLGK